MNPKQHKQKKAYAGILLLALIILAQIALNTYSFAVKKTAYYEDEFFSYALSNSYRYPFIYGSALQVPDRFDDWTTGQEFHDYINVNSETAFRYDSVWYNQSADVHPPLYYAVLHTICSFFPEHFSWWYAYLINVIALIITQIFLYLLVIELCRSKAAALVTCAFWGFTIAAQGNFIYIRMYGMLTMFTVIYIYYSFRLFSAEKPAKRAYIAVIVTALLGALTHHYFLIPAFLITLLECICFLAAKKWKKMFAYGFSALGGILLSVLLFPATVPHLMPGRILYSEKPKLSEQWSIFTGMVLEEMTGLSYIFGQFFWIDILTVLIFAAIFGAPLMFLFRKETWMLRFFERVKKIPAKLLGGLHGLLTKHLRELILLAASVIYLLIVSYTVYSQEHGLTVSRYIQLLPPMLCAAVISLLYTVFRHIGFKPVRMACHIALPVLLAGLLVFQNTEKESEYLIKNDPENGTIRSYVQDENCILLTASPIYLPCFSIMMQDADDIFLSVLTDSYYKSGGAQLEAYQKMFEKGDSFMLVMDGSRLFSDEDTKRYEELLQMDESEYANDIGAWLLLKRFDEEMTMDAVVSYFEDISGFEAEYCTSETTHEIKIECYRYTKKN